MNSETIKLFDETNGYRNWLRFLDSNANKKDALPCALYIEDGTRENFQKQVEGLLVNHEKICLRTSVADENASKLYGWIAEVTDIRNVISCANLYYIEPRRLQTYQTLCRTYLETVVGNRVPDSVLFPGSSFPRFVTDVEGSNDLEGEFEAREITLEAELRKQFANFPIQPSDFASVHPIRYETGGGNWIPRIDIFDGTNFRYVRARRDDGGYDLLHRNLIKV